LLPGRGHPRSCPVGDGLERSPRAVGQTHGALERLESPEDATLGRRPVGELGDGEQHTGQECRRGLVVRQRGRVVVADRDRPDHAAEKPVRPGAVLARMHVQVVPVRTEHVAEGVRRVADLDLDAFEALLEEPAEAAGPLQRIVRPLRGAVEAQFQLDQRLGIPRHEIVVVVALQEDEALALELLAYEVEQAVGGGQCVFDLGEQEVEQVAEHDQLVDVQVRLEQRELLRLAQQVLPRPRAEVRVRDHQRAHH
jgi:hypothetical protein